jgi:hypothetical protein
MKCRPLLCVVCFLVRSAILVACPVLAVLPVLADEPKPTKENTISLQLVAPVKPQTFPRPIKFFVADVVDRSGNPQPMLVFRPRGGVFVDREPVVIVRQALEDSLRAAGLLAESPDAADFVFTVYVFHFGLGSGSGFVFFGKVELNVVIKVPKSGKTQQITALGTSIQGLAARKKNILKNIQADLTEALEDALRNFLRGAKLRDALAALEPPAPPAK